nr:hypothetical protein [Tanacetum cinerariifolium]
MLLAKEKLIKAIRTCLKNNNQPPEEKSIAILLAEESILTVMQTLEEKQIDTEKSIDETPPSDTIAPDLPITDSLVMENEHLDTIPKTDSDEEIESSVKNLNLTLSESEDLSDYISDEINPLYNEVLEDLDPILPGNENDHFNAESNLIESLLNKDTVITSPKIDFLLEEFAGLNSENGFEKENSGSTNIHTYISLIEYESFYDESDSASEIFNDDLAHIISPSEVWKSGLQLVNPPYQLDWTNIEFLVSERSPITTTARIRETYKNISQDIRDKLNAEAEEVQIILTGIDNDIYSTVDACPNACGMWKAIKRSQQAAIRNRGKAIVNSPQPIYDQEPPMVDEDDETSKDKEIDKLMALISLSNVGYENQRNGTVAGARETVGSTVRPKRAKDAAYHREKMLLCKQEEAGIQLNAEQADWRDDTDDDELEDQELEAHYMYMAQLQQVSPDAADSGPIFDDEPLQKVSNNDHYNVFAIESTHPEQSEYVHDTYPIQQDVQNVIIGSLDMSYDREEIDQNDDDNDLAKERELLASLIEKLKCEIDESKNRNKFLETSNKVLIEKLKGEIEDFKNKNKNLESSNNFFKEANNRLSETNNLLYADYKKSEAELARRNSMEYASQMELECAKVRDKLSAHQETISILSKQKEAQIKLYKTREDKEIDKVIELENKVK